MNEHIIELVDELYELGIEDIVLSPGSRSTPLAMLFCEHKFNIYMDIDERSAAFFALGMAKAKQKAVVLVCTSGSACAHYLPAAIEAKFSRIPLIFLTADRPARLQNVGAPQTINQKYIFGEFVKYFEELVFSDNSQYSVSQTSYPRLVMQKALMQANSAPKMPVHINIPLEEPLVPNLTDIDFSKNRRKHAFNFLVGNIKNNDFIEHFIENYGEKNGLIICGPSDFVKDNLYYENLIALSNVLGAPLIADPLSQLRSFNNVNIITTYDAFLKNEQLANELTPDYILLLDQAPVSKRLFQFILAQKNTQIIQLDACADYRNPALNTSTFVQISKNSFVQALLLKKEKLTKNYPQDYAKKWIQAQAKMSNILTSARLETELFEGKIIQLIQDITSDNSIHNENSMHLMFANSMSIRDADFFWEAKAQQIKFFGNRGANGIDGTISTALGISAATNMQEHCKAKLKQSNTVLVCGDLAFLHDITALLIGITHKINLTIVLFNNNGGGIFQYLPQADTKNFEYLFLTPHNISFEGLSKLNPLEHYRINSYDEFIKTFSKALHSQGIHILELPISMQKSKDLHTKYTNYN